MRAPVRPEAQARQHRKEIGDSGHPLFDLAELTGNACGNACLASFRGPAHGEQEKLIDLHAGEFKALGDHAILSVSAS
jgi:hypothetical protein